MDKEIVITEEDIKNVDTSNVDNALNSIHGRMSEAEIVAADYANTLFEMQEAEKKKNADILIGTKIASINEETRKIHQETKNTIGDKYKDVIEQEISWDLFENALGVNYLAATDQVKLITRNNNEDLIFNNDSNLYGPLKEIYNVTKSKTRELVKEREFIKTEEKQQELTKEYNNVYDSFYGVLKELKENGTYDEDQFGEVAKDVIANINTFNRIDNDNAADIVYTGKVNGEDITLKVGDPLYEAVDLAWNEYSMGSFSPKETAEVIVASPVELEKEAIKEVGQTPIKVAADDLENLKAEPEVETIDDKEMVEILKDLEDKKVDIENPDKSYWEKHAEINSNKEQSAIDRSKALIKLKYFELDNGRLTYLNRAAILLATPFSYAIYKAGYQKQKIGKFINKTYKSSPLIWFKNNSLRKKHSQKEMEERTKQEQVETETSIDKESVLTEENIEKQIPVIDEVVKAEETSVIEEVVKTEEDLKVETPLEKSETQIIEDAAKTEEAPVIEEVKEKVNTPEIPGVEQISSDKTGQQNFEALTDNLCANIEKEDLSPDQLHQRLSEVGLTIDYYKESSTRRFNKRIKQMNNDKYTKAMSDDIHKKIGQSSNLVVEQIDPMTKEINEKLKQDLETMKSTLEDVKSTNEMSPMTSETLNQFYVPTPQPTNNNELPADFTEQLNQLLNPVEETGKTK